MAGVGERAFNLTFDPVELTRGQAFRLKEPHTYLTGYIAMIPNRAVQGHSTFNKLTSFCAHPGSGRQHRLQPLLRDVAHL